MHSLTLSSFLSFFTVMLWRHPLSQCSFNLIQSKPYGQPISTHTHSDVTATGLRNDRRYAWFGQKYINIQYVQLSSTTLFTDLLNHSIVLINLSWSFLHQVLINVNVHDQKDLFWLADLKSTDQCWLKTLLVHVILQTAPGNHFKPLQSLRLYRPHRTFSVYRPQEELVTLQTTLIHFCTPYQTTSVYRPHKTWTDESDSDYRWH